MIEINNLSKSYNKGSVKAVDNLDLHVKPGEIFGFIGPNGAGKTTTIKMIVGLLNPDSGSVTINGFDYRRQMLEAKKNIGYVPDNPGAISSTSLKAVLYLRKQICHRYDK